MSTMMLHTVVLIRNVSNLVVISNAKTHTIRKSHWVEFVKTGDMTASFKPKLYASFVPPLVFDLCVCMKHVLEDAVLERMLRSVMLAPTSRFTRNILRRRRDCPLNALQLFAPEVP